MKKTIIYSALALVAFFNVSIASATTTTTRTPGFELVKDYGNATPLAVAIAKGDVETVKKFIEYGVNINETSNGMTPLMIAARYNQVEIINMLLEKGADLKAKDEKGFNALKYAQISKAEGAIEALKAAEA